MCIRGQIENILDIDNIEQIRITTLGMYHIFSLVTVFQYIDAIIIDTPILNSDIRERITLESDIESRLARTEIFFDYLNNCSGSIQDSNVREIWKNIYKTLNVNIKEIRGNIRK